MTPQQAVTALAVAALNNDAQGLAPLLADLGDDEVRSAAGIAVINLCSGFRQIVHPDDWQEITAALQTLAAQEAAT
ncbi:hypothetical protein [Streptomyces sp. NBC_00582]|uniref:hypothetical protein n=1 Tax=Streptomyces sp. NBC_00582 TaxID=2975783 RepID=UPI002E811C24|nr:hypothetical protein [Streptomyces sp. NBC_00582]WUB60438.1 hypothetical protein OG852_08600 [Streptomyces sp. NBC_00582]